MKLHKRKIISLMIYMIERDACTPHVLVDLNHPGNKRLARLIDSTKDRVVIDISRRALTNRQVLDRFLVGRTRLGGRSLTVKIPLSSIDSLFAREHRVGWRFSA